MSNFDRAFNLLLEHEGGYSNHLYDPGGKTMFGITEAVARENNYRGEMRELPLEVAKDIYNKQYWNPYFYSIPFIVAFNVFDGAVHSGQWTSIRWLQEASGASIDGLFGTQTLNRVLDSNPFILSAKYNALRLDYMTRLGNWKYYNKGWARRIAHNLSLIDG